MTYTIYNLHCRGCAIHIEEQIQSLPGVSFASIDELTHHLVIEGSAPDLIELNKIADEILPGVYFEPYSTDTIDEDVSWTPSLWIASLFFIIGILFQEKLYKFSPSVFTDTIFFGIPYVLCGWSVLLQGLKCVLRKDFFNEFTLMGGATLVAIALGDFPEAVGVMFFYRIGEYIQERTLVKSKKSIRALLATKPSIAHLVQKDHIQDVSPESLQPGASLLVKPGEKIPLDGIVESGTSQVDTSPLTGESIPTVVHVGSQVFGGTINIMGSLIIKATATYKDSSISRMLELVENAIARKAPTERFITRFARYYTPLVVLSAMLVAILPPLFGIGTLQEWIYRGLILIVISCPCALLISIPLGYLGGIGAASRHGILVKGGNVFDALQKIKIVAFDKTGTLTKATFEVTGILLNKGVSREYLLQSAAIAVTYSSHPIVRPILNIVNQKPQVSGIVLKEIPGKGIIATYKETSLIVGNETLLREHGFEPIIVDRPGSIIHVARDANYLGVIVVTDTLKSDAVEAVRCLKKYVNKVVMLTGDRPDSAESIAKIIQVDEYRAGLLPEDKVAVIESFGPIEQTLFVGDGINDAPVLAYSGVGVAMGKLGAESAIEVADVVILDDSPVRVVDLIRIARKTYIIVLQNIILALGIKTVIMGFGIAGLSTLWEAVFADVGVALLAVFNSTRAGKLKSF